MISTKKLINMARKWKKLAAASRRRISWPTPAVANKGHFVIYTTDGRRFMIPLVYLQSEILRELLKTAEEEFGLISEGPSHYHAIQLSWNMPCCKSGFGESSYHVLGQLPLLINIIKNAARIQQSAIFNL